MDHGKRECLYIPSVDAKDLYLANHCLDREKQIQGYDLHTKGGDINLTKFRNSFDLSLDLPELKRIAHDCLPKSDPFTFSQEGKTYSDKIINVTFKYCSKVFNKRTKNTYILNGYDIRDLNFDDCIAVKDGEITGIMTDTPVLSSQPPQLPDHFQYVQSGGQTIIRAGAQKNLKDIRELRLDLYEHGFLCEGRRYVRFKRTSGSARVGKCLFIDERLYPRIHQWELCGLTVKENDPVDLAALETYLSLSASSIIGTIQIQPENILVIPDFTSTFQEPSIIVSYGEEHSLTTSEAKADISNSVFDGQSLIDKSIMGKYSRFGMLLLRNRFFKSCCFNTNIGTWFQDRGIDSLDKLHPEAFTLAKDISDIKLITTPSSIKYMKFGSLRLWLESISPEFGIVKHEKKTPFFHGRMVQTHYQLLNTIQLSREEVDELLVPSLQYVSLLNTDTDVLRRHVRCGVCEADSPNVSDNIMMDKNDVIYTMMKLSPLFFRTKLFYDFKKEVCKSYLKNLKKGHILIDGNYSTLFGNPYEMLLQSIGAFDGTTTLPPGYIHTTRYPFGKMLLGCRSPHISTSNILLAVNRNHEQIDRYFNLTQEIVCVNAIGENTLERLSGADYDSDQMIVTDNDILIRSALKNYSCFQVPANQVMAEKSCRCYTASHQADLDHRTSDNRIGEIVNLSQELNSILWDRVHKGGKPLSQCYDSIRDLYHDICLLNVLSCIEIDKAKKEFKVEVGFELKRIKEKWREKTADGKTILPGFLGYLSSAKGYEPSSGKEFCTYHTTMDYLVTRVGKHRSAKTKASEFVKLSDCFYFEGFNQNSVNKKQLNKIVMLCETVRISSAAVWAKSYYSSEEKLKITSEAREQLYTDIRAMKINRHTLYVLLSYMDKKKYSPISRLLFSALFQYENQTFTDLLNAKEPVRTYLKEDPHGTISLYGVKYNRCTKGDSYEQT